MRALRGKDYLTLGLAKNRGSIQAEDSSKFVYCLALRIFRRVDLVMLQLLLQHHLAHMVRLRFLRKEVLVGDHH
jgi:hypothetical protein